MLSQIEILHGVETLNTNTEQIGRKAGCQSPVEIWQYGIPKPALDESGDTVKPCGVFTNPKDQYNAQLIYRVPPNTTNFSAGKKVSSSEKMQKLRSH